MYFANVVFSWILKIWKSCVCFPFFSVNLILTLQHRSGSILITGEVVMSGTGNDADLINKNAPPVLQLVEGIDSVISQGAGLPAGRIQ